MWRWRIWRRSSSPCTKRSSSSRNNCTSRKQKRKNIPWWLKNSLLRYITPAYHHARSTTSPNTKKEIHMFPHPTTATSSMITPTRLGGRTASPTSSCGGSFKERARRIWVLWRRKECTSIRWASSTTKAINLSGIGHLSTVILIYVDSY